MVYRYSWIAGAAALVFAFTGLNDLLRPTGSGTKWQFIVIAALVLGATITWTALSYRAHPIIVILLNLVAMSIAVTRIAAPEGTSGLIPGNDTLVALRDHLGRALELIRTGIEPVQPLPGIVIIVAVVFWVTGMLLTWGLMRGHPYLALVPPLVLALQFATMDRNRTGLLRTLVFLVVVAGSIIAVTTDERDQAAGRMARPGQAPGLRNRLAPSALGLLGMTLAISVVGTGVMAGLVPFDGVLPWRTATGLTSDFYGGIAYNPFIGIQRSLVTQSDTPVFLAQITGDVPPEQVYFRLVTMETYKGSQFHADKPTVVDLETRPWEERGNRFAGPTANVTTSVQIERLTMDWLPETYVPTSFSADGDVERIVRVRQADGSLRLEGDITYQGLTYTVESEVPQPDMAALATGADGELSPAFALAAEEEEQVPDPKVVPIREEPADAEVYLQLPDDLDEGIAELAREQTANLATNYEIGIALESWFHSPEFQYSTDVRTGHDAADLATWLLDEEATGFYHTGYCENFATAMAVMARTLGVPSRVVLGFTPGEPTGQENVVVVRDRNAHAWVELWIPSQGWMRFDPTPRGDGLNPSTYGLAETQLGFSLTSYLDVPDPDPITGQNPLVRMPQPFDDRTPVFGGGDTDTTSGGLSVPGWITSIFPYGIVAILLLGAIPTVKWWRRRRRMKRLESGDITAAWEDIVARLSDLGERPSPAATPRELAASVDGSMLPLAVVYGRSVYGPEGSIEESHIETATRSLADTRSILADRYGLGQRLVAAYRPTSIIPSRIKRTAVRMKPNRNGSRTNGNGTSNGSQRNGG
jgi:transglutaminase-like putative cysteine protease